MPDLPGSTPERDIYMFQQALTRSDLQFDDIKIYPTAICKSEDENIIVTSDIATWYNEGSYMPYAEKNIQDLIDVLKYYKKNCPPWVRIQRLVRDIPSTSIIAGYEKMSNLRQYIHNQMAKEGTRCQCIRCLEIDHNIIINPVVVVYRYEASNGIEYHIQIEMFNDNNDYKWFQVKNILSQLFLGKKLYYPGCTKTRKHVIGFCRLRIDNNPGAGFIKELKNCALIREVHVYGSSISIGNSQTNSSQHSGFGKLLVKTAEDIVIQENKPNINKMAIIAGVGTRKYYSDKCGYKLEGTYMVKNLSRYIQKYNVNKIYHFSYIIIIIIALLCYLLY
jgi:elongator complex protein 3